MSWPVRFEPQIPKETSVTSLPLTKPPTATAAPWSASFGGSKTLPAVDVGTNSDVDSRLRRNRQLLVGSEEIPVKTSLAVLDNLYSRWCPPMVLPAENLFATSQWAVRAGCKMDRGLLCVRLTGYKC
jgi:hypothetical protein